MVGGLVRCCVLADRFHPRNESHDSDDKNTVGSWSIQTIFTLRRGWQEGIEESQGGEEVSHHL